MCNKTLIPIISCVILGSSLLTALAQEDTDDFVPVANPVETLKMVGAQARGNYERIKTWQGEYSFQDKEFQEGEQARSFGAALGITVPSRYVKVSEGSFSFDIDQKSDSIFLNFQASKIFIETLASKEKKQIEKKACEPYLDSRISVLTPEDYCYFDTRMAYSVFGDFSDLPQSTSAVVFREPREKGKKLYFSTIPDPRTFFVYGGSFIWEFCDMFSKPGKPLAFITDDGYDNKIRILKSRDDDLQQYIFSQEISVNDRKTVFRYLIDGKSGFNVIDYSCTRNEGEGEAFRCIVQISLEYKQYDGIFTPFHIKQKLGPTEQNGVFKFKRTLKLLDNKFNGILPSDPFSYKRFGMNKRDRLRDNIDKKLYEYNGDELVELKPEGSQILKGKISWLRIILICVTIILIACIIIILILRRNKK